MMKKTCIFAIMFSMVMTITCFAGEWKQDSSGWKYQKDDGVYACSSWQMIDSQWYYFNHSGYMATNTLTPDGYWLDENGLMREDERIYGTAVFNPTSYEIKGDKIEIIGNLCDTGYASQDYINSLKIGDYVMRPALYSNRVSEFTMQSRITEIKISDGLKTVATEVTFSDKLGDYTETYWMNSQFMNMIPSEGMDGPRYRVVKKDIKLIADANTSFIPGEYKVCNSMKEFLNQWVSTEYPNEWAVLEVIMEGSHIEKAVDRNANYAG